jgi:Ca2+-transporting ATPase
MPLYFFCSFPLITAQKENRKIKLIRSGAQMLVTIYDAVVGDVALVEMGDILPADGILIEGHHVKCDESKLTGESDAIKKSEKDPFLLSGTQVLEGTGRMLITAVGGNSIFGRVRIVSFLLLLGSIV